MIETFVLIAIVGGMISIVTGMLGSTGIFGIRGGGISPIIFGMLILLAGTYMFSDITTEDFFNSFNETIPETPQQNLSTNTQTDYPLETTTELNDEDLLSDSSLLDLGGI